jgi:hypothetical protein
MRLIDWLVDKWVSDCNHNPNNVDLFESSIGDSTINYCRRCGSVKLAQSKEWCRPRPTWFREN